MKKSDISRLSEDLNDYEFYSYRKNFNFEKDLVMNFVEKFFPYIFWIGFCFIIFNSLNESIGLIELNFFEGLFMFFRVFIPNIIIYFLLFYILFTLKDINNSLEKK